MKRAMCLWQSLSDRGNQESFSIEKQKRVIFLNRFCFLMVVIPLMLSVRLHFFFHATIIAIFFMCTLALSALALYANRYGYAERTEGKYLQKARER
jgi:hypothetical protein